MYFVGFQKALHIHHFIALLLNVKAVGNYVSNNPPPKKNPQKTIRRIALIEWLAGWETI